LDTLQGRENQEAENLAKASLDGPLEQDEPARKWVGSNCSKRAFDLALLGLSLPFWASILALAACTIRMQGKGSIFFKHKRIGFQGRPFLMWKFRTMLPDSDRVFKEHLETHPEAMEEWLATRKLKNDPRITSLGKFMRRYSIDELPQLINVWLGDMSLVGPRPIADANEAEQWGRSFAYYQQARPGLTGLWQVSGRSNTSYSERIAYDVLYVKNWSLKLDCFLLAKTVSVVLKGDGAY
jgi:exopolysaccharide production protein ExoY